MHVNSILRMKWFVENYASKIIKDKIKVLDVGSYNINGSYKELFDTEKFEYLGLDIEKGPNVDIVLNNPYDWSGIETDSFDIVISGQTFEHTEFFWITVAEMARVLKKDGLLCLIAPNGFKEHRYPVDCYRFFADGMVALARYVSLETLHADTNCSPNDGKNNWHSEKLADSMLVAKKTYSGMPVFINPKTYKCVPADPEVYRTGFIPYKPNLLRKLFKK
jgi:SAM-dependent methyltransferase